MSILDVDEERAKELVAKHGSVEEAIKHGDDAAADDDEGDAPGETNRTVIAAMRVCVSGLEAVDRAQKRGYNTCSIKPISCNANVHPRAI